MEPIYRLSDLFVRSRDQPTGEPIIDAVVTVLRETNLSWPKEVAKRLGVRKDHLSGAIRILTGESLESMIKQWRLLQAMYLVKTTKKDFAEIARLCGFSKSKTLARAMKQYLRVSPHDYRN